MRKKINTITSIAVVILVMVLTGSIMTNIMVAHPKKKTKMKPDHSEFYKYARYLFTKNERKTFLNLPDDELRERFIRYFWEIRDPNPYTEENEFKLEIERRFEYASKYLKEGPIPGWKSDRGRIYILLGPPSNKLEEFAPPGSSFAASIYWYYEETNIYARFIDEHGTGIYRMDLRFVSLKLLDELEKRKYYIVNEEKSKFETDALDFHLDYDSKSNEIRIAVDTRDLNYDKDPDSDDDRMTAKIKVDLIVYDNKDNFFKHSKVQTVYVQKDILLKKKSKITVNIPLTLPKGKVKIDAVVADFLGEAVHRKLVKIKN